MTLPTDPKARKAAPVFSGVLKYFPDAIAAVAELSRIGNEQHNPGSPLHWDRSKSQDEGDALARHLLEAGTIDTDGVRHSTKVAWRALALLQKEIEAARDVPSERVAAAPAPAAPLANVCAYYECVARLARKPAAAPAPAARAFTVGDRVRPMVGHRRGELATVEDCDTLVCQARFRNGDLYFYGVAELMLEPDSTP
jgi:hypothetical protein